MEDLISIVLKAHSHLNQMLAVCPRGALGGQRPMTHNVCGRGCGMSIGRGSFPGQLELNYIPLLHITG